jgi:hypothetical protein
LQRFAEKLSKGDQYGGCKIQRNHPENGVPIKAWTRGVPLEDAARNQLLNVAQLPFIYKWVAAMPDVHWGIGRRLAA